jgi:hypothetical protein
MLYNYFSRLALMVTLFVGHSIVLNAQECKTPCSGTTQYGLNEVIICNKEGCGQDGDFSFSRSASLSPTVTFQTEGFSFCIDPSDKLFIDLGDGTGFRQIPGTVTFTVTYPTPGILPSANIKTIRIRRGDSKIVFTKSFMIKRAAPYVSPDFVKRIETPNVFNPANQIGFPTVSAAMFPDKGAKYMAVSKGVGHAYVRCSPQNGGKIKKPIIFVDGIDFDSEDKNYYDPALGAGKTDANVIRHGVTGWDIFITGAEDGFSEAVPNAREDFREYRNVFDNLWDKGYDVIFLDFAEGATWIQKNAQVLKATLLWINEEKSKNGSKFENIIVGPSMGGQVARIALAEMERDNVNHCTKMYISFDSPHQGAHIPLGLQSMAFAAYDSKFDCDKWVKLNQPAARQLLTYHLANEIGLGKIQMNKTLIEPPINTGSFPVLVKPSREESTSYANPNDLGMIRTAYVNYLNQLGYPKQTNNLAIADGNINGLGQAALNGQKVFDANVHITDNSSFVLNVLQKLGQVLPPPLSLIQPKFTISPSSVNELGITGSVAVLQGLNVLPLISTYNTLNNLVDNDKKRVNDLKMYALPGTNSPLGTFNLHAGAVLAQGDFLHLNFNKTVANNTIFEWALAPTKTPKNYFKYHAQISPSAVPFLLNLDNVPGAGRSDLIGLEDVLRKEGSQSLGGVQFTQPQFNTFLHRSPLNFISTFSALDVQEPMTNVSLNGNIDGNISNGVSKIPFEDYYAPRSPALNLNHVEVDVPMRTKVLQWVDEYQEDLLLVGQLPFNGKSTYNYGLWRKRIPSTVINGGGQLRVNNEGATAFLNEGAATKPVFEAWITDCGGANILIKPEGIFSIGSNNSTKKGIVHISNQSTVTVDGGELRLQKGSILYIEKGGTLHIKSGILRVMENSEIIVQEGGKLIIDPDANVALNNSSVAGSSEARIVTKKNGELIFTGLNAAGLNFAFSGNGHFAFDKGNILNIQTSTLSLRGMGKNTRFIRLNGAAEIKLKNKNIRLENGQIEYLPSSGIVGEEGISTVSLSNISAKPSNNKGSFGTAFELSYSTGTVTIVNSDFTEMGTGCHLRGTEYNVLISNSLFENCKKGFFSSVNYGAIDIRTNTRFLDNIVGCQIDANSGAVDFSFVEAQENAAGIILRGSAKLDIVNMTNCNIARNGTAGVIVDNIPSLVLQDCIIEFHNNESYERHNQNILDFAGQNVIIDIPECETDLSSNVIEFSAGVYDMQNSNIIATYGTVIKDNNYGIFKNTNYFIQGGASLQDAVILNCMTLSNNYFGVKGSNIELQADAFSSGGTPNWSINPNRFILGQGKFLFDICYDGKYAPIPKAILMRENYWETNAGAGKAPDPMSINFKNACVEFCEHCSTLNNCIPYETAPENTNPTDCMKAGKPNPTNPNFVDVAAQGATSLTVMGYLGENTPVHAQYRSAFAALLQGKTSNVEDAMQRFATIAALPITAGTDNVGAQYIRVARAFVDYNPNGNEIQTLSRVQKARAVIYPNPTDNIFSINLEKGAYAVSIVDMQGRVVYQQNTEGNLEVETEKWLSGIYQIFITNKNTGTETTEKVVVMKY